MRKRSLFVAALAIVLNGAAAESQQGTYGPTNPADPALNQGPKKEAVGETFIVSTQLASSTLAAVDAVLGLPGRGHASDGNTSHGGDRKGMAARGIKIEDIGDFNFHTGSMQIVWRNPETGKIHGVTDPRRLGYAEGQ